MKISKRLLLGMIFVYAAALIACNKAVLSKTSTGIFNLENSQNATLSERHIVSIADVSEKSKDFVLFERPISQDEIIMRTIDFDGKEKDRKIIKQSWRPLKRRNGNYALSPDHRRIVVLGFDNMKIVDVAGSKVIDVLALPSPNIVGIKWVSNSAIVIAANWANDTKLDVHLLKYDVDQKKVVKKLAFKGFSEFYFWQWSKYIGVNEDTSPKKLPENVYTQEKAMVIKQRLRYGDRSPNFLQGGCKISIIDPETMNVVKTYEPGKPTIRVSDMAISHTGEHLALSSFYLDSSHDIHDEIRLINLKTNTEKILHKEDAMNMTFIKDGTLAYVYFNPKMYPTPRVYKLDIGTGKSDFIIESEQFFELFCIDNGKKLLYSIY